MSKFPVQLQYEPGQMYRGQYLQQGRGACTRLGWLWRQVSRHHFVLGDHQDLGAGCLWWRLHCGGRSSPTWSLAGVTLWRFPAGRFLSMSSKWKSFSLRHSFRIGTNDSVDQIFLFLHHHFLYHVYVHDPRLNQSFHPNHHLLLKGYDKSMHEKASVLPEEERVYLIIHLCRHQHLNLP